MYLREEKNQLLRDEIMIFFSQNVWVHCPFKSSLKLIEFEDDCDVHISFHDGNNRYFKQISVCSKNVKLFGLSYFYFTFMNHYCLIFIFYATAKRTSSPTFPSLALITACWTFIWFVWTVGWNTPALLLISHPLWIIFHKIDLVTFRSQCKPVSVDLVYFKKLKVFFFVCVITVMSSSYGLKFCLNLVHRWTLSC